MIDINAIRNFVIASNGLTKVDDVYAIYYDETNNDRRIHIRSDGLNVKEPKCFVVGGIAHRGHVRDLNFGKLRSALRLQKTVKDMKFEHVTKGDFCHALNAQKLETYLRWLRDQGLFVHYSAVDPLYWSIVDVIDSILAEHRDASLRMYHLQLKNDLYAILRYELTDTIELLQRYSYPNVGRERRSAFVAELREFLEQRDELLPHFNYMKLKGVLQIAENLRALPFLEDEKPNVLVDCFGPFFVNRICLFRNSEHIFDDEEVVKDYLAGEVFVDEGRILSNHRFAKSDDEPGVQISDVIVGLVGRFFTFIQSTERSDLVECRNSLAPQQQRNLGLLKELLDRSCEENVAFAHSVLSLEDLERADNFLRDSA
jgi:hypothetical protein